MEVRPIDKSDAAPLDAFFRRISDGERMFFKEDVLDPEVQAGIFEGRSGSRKVAVGDDGEIVGYLAIIPGIGWSSHVGEVRLVVDPGHREEGIGRRLARQGLLDALELGLEKVFVEVVADQAPAVAMFQALGFEGEAVLRGHVRGRRGDVRDLIILAHPVHENWATMATIGIEDEVGNPS